METKQINIFEKILYGQKITNDNIVILNEKVDTLIAMFSINDSESGVSFSETNKDAQ